MPPKEPTTLAGAKFKHFGFSESHPKLLEKLSLGDGLLFFLGWRRQLLDFDETSGFHPSEFPMEEYLDPALFNLLVERMGTDLDGLDYDDLARELLYIFEEKFDEEEQDEIALEDLNISAGRSGKEKSPEPPDSSKPHPMADQLPEPSDSPMHYEHFCAMTDSPIPGSPMADHLPDPIPPDTLADHLPDPIPPDTLADHLPDPIPPDTLADHLPNPIPPDTLPDILLDPIPPDILLDAQADSIAPAPPWGERRGDGDHYAPVPYVDPGGQQPEVIGALCGRGLNDWKRYRSNRGRFKDHGRFQICTSDRRKYRSNRGRFRPSSGDRRRSYRANRGRFKKPVFYLV